VHLWHTPSFCSRCFPFRLIAPNYIVYKSCGSYLPLRQDLEQSPLLSSRFQSSISVSFSVACLLLSVSPAQCVLLGVFFSLVCSRLVWPHSVCFPSLASAARALSLVSATCTPTIQLSPVPNSLTVRRLADLLICDIVQKGPGFDRRPFASCLPLSFYCLWDSGTSLCSLG
jgi:hypothetical protein